MSNEKTFYATRNIKCDGVAYVKGDEISGLSEENIKTLTGSDAISTDKPVIKEPDTNARDQSPSEKADARKAKGQDSQETKDKNRPEVGGESSDSGEASIDSDEGKENGASDSSEDSADDAGSEEGAGEAGKGQYKVLKGVEFPKGTPHEEGTVLELSDEEASGFAEGLIEKIESTDDDQSDDNNSQSDPAKDL